MLRKAPFCMGNFSKNFLNFFSPDGSRIRFPLPGKRRETASRKRLFCISSILGGFDFLSGETEEATAGKPFFASFPSSVVRFPLWGNEGCHSREAALCISSILGNSDFSLRKNRGKQHQEPGRKTFFLAKSFSLCNLPLGACKFTFQKCALRGIPPIAMGGQGSSPWTPPG